MKSLLEEMQERMKNIEYCVYCNEARDGKSGCCQENHFVPFSDLDTETQFEIITEELA